MGLLSNMVFVKYGPMTMKSLTSIELQTIVTPLLLLPKNGVVRVGDVSCDVLAVSGSGIPVGGERLWIMQAIVNKG